MKKIILASAAAVALLGIAACSDNTDKTTTQSVDQPPATTEQPAPATPNATKPPATDNTTTQSVTPTPQTGTGGDMQGSEPTQPKPVQPGTATPEAPAQ